MPKCSFNKVAKHIFRTTLRKNTSGWLLLQLLFDAFILLSGAVMKIWKSPYMLVFTEAATRGVLLGKVFSEISQNSEENTSARVSFLIFFIKKVTLAQVFSCEFCEISKNTFFTEHLWATASSRTRRVTRGGRSPLPFFENWKKVP